MQLLLEIMNGRHSHTCKRVYMENFILFEWNYFYTSYKRIEGDSSTVGGDRMMGRQIHKTLKSSVSLLCNIYINIPFVNFKFLAKSPALKLLNLNIP